MRLLISRIDAIGDVCLTLPAIGWLKSNFPNYHVNFLVQAYAAPVVKAFHWVDEITVLDKTNFKDIFTQLKSSNTDQIIHISPDKQIAKAAKVAGIKIRSGVIGRVYNWFYCNRLIKLSRSGSGQHESYLNLLAITRSLKLPDPDFNEFKKNIITYAGLSNLRQPSSGKKSHVILHPFSRGSGREWPLANFIELAKLLANNHLIPVMAGINSDFEQIKPYVDQFPIQTVWVMGEGDLSVYMKRIGESAGLVASGTGPLHISSLINVPSVGLFPPRKDIDPARWGTTNPLGISLSSKADCEKKCSNKDCACMANISPQIVFNQLSELIKKDQKNI